MQDRFKFRYFYNGTIYDVFAVDFMNKTAQLVSLDRKEILLKGIDTDKLIQCTGLKDKNDKLIYEGDIVKIGNGSINGSVIETTREVKWTINTWNVPVWVVDKPNFSHYVEVIGNIYENPKLLEDKR